MFILAVSNVAEARGMTQIAEDSALSPGRNMAYLVSPSICQGRPAVRLSLGGGLVGFAIYVVLTACGITALLLAVPLAYDALHEHPSSTSAVRVNQANLK